jgi:hypothetical protein
MNSTIWTLWLITSGSIIGQGATPPPVAVPIATYDSHDLCIGALQQIYADTESVYGKKNAPRFPGFFFCVSTTHRK